MGNNSGLWKCTACRDHHWLGLRNTRCHESSSQHQQAVQYRLQVPDTEATPSTIQHVVGPLYDLLQDVTHASSIGLNQDDHQDGMILDWKAISSQISGDLAPTAAQGAVTALTTSLLDWLAAAPESERDLSDSEPDEQSDDGLSQGLEEHAPGMVLLITA